MAEYLDREALRCAVMASKHDNLHLNSIYRKAHDDEHLHFLAMIDRFPAADVAPVVHGRWEFLGPNRLVKECMCGTCSVCKVRSKYIVNPTLCPNCGAKMELQGGKNEP